MLNFVYFIKVKKSYYNFDYYIFRTKKLYFIDLKDQNIDFNSFKNIWITFVIVNIIYFIIDLLMVKRILLIFLEGIQFHELKEGLYIFILSFLQNEIIPYLFEKIKICFCFLWLIKVLNCNLKEKMKRYLAITNHFFNFGVLLS